MATEDNLQPLASFDVTDFTPPWVTDVIQQLRAENERLRELVREYACFLAEHGFGPEADGVWHALDG